jgi:hypothetical protein
MPKPVTSVAAWAACLWSASAPWRLRARHRLDRLAEQRGDGVDGGGREIVLGERLGQLLAGVVAHERGRALRDNALAEPLGAIDGELSAERLGEHEHVAGTGVNRTNELVLASDDRGDAANDRPRVLHSLAAGDADAGGSSGIVEAHHDELGGAATHGRVHVGGGGEEHEERVDVSETERIDVGEDIGTRNATLSDGVVHQRIEEVGGRNEKQVRKASGLNGTVDIAQKRFLNICRSSSSRSGGWS